MLLNGSKKGTSIILSENPGSDNEKSVRLCEYLLNSCVAIAIECHAIIVFSFCA